MDPNEILKFIRLTYAGLSDGALLALIALGLVLVFKATDVINFAHGEFMMLGSYIGFQALRSIQDALLPMELNESHSRSHHSCWWGSRDDSRSYCHRHIS